MSQAEGRAIPAPGSAPAHAPLPRLHRSTLPPWRSMLSAWAEPVAALALVSTAAVAALDEWHQTSLPGRTGIWKDVVLDSMAAVFVQAVILVLSDLRLQAPGSRLQASGSKQEHEEQKA